MDIHLIRHGQTEANEKKLYCGKTNVPLSQQGIALIADIKRQGIYPKDINLFFTSGFLRAEQTLTYIYGAVHREALPQLAEYNFGRFEMKSYEELIERADYQAWVADDSGQVPCPDGESRQQFMSRVLAGYDLLLAKSRGLKAVLLVSHGGVIASVMDALFPKVHHFYDWQPKPGRGYTLTYTLDGFCSYKLI